MISKIKKKTIKTYFIVDPPEASWYRSPDSKLWVTVTVLHNAQIAEPLSESENSTFCLRAHGQGNLIIIPLRSHPRARKYMMNASQLPNQWVGSVFMQ